VPSTLDDEWHRKNCHYLQVAKSCRAAIFKYLEGHLQKPLMRKVPAIVIVLVAATVLFGKSSKLMMSWKNPAYSPATKFHRVLALGLSNKTEVRADFEDALAADLSSKGYEAVPGNAILLRPAGTQLDLNYLREQIRANQIDAVVVSRLVKVDNTVTYVPGTAYVAPFPYYNTFYGYYGALYPVVYSPGYLQKEKKVRVETNLYFVNGAPDGQLVWTGITDTFNPSNVHKAIKGLVNLVVTKMQKEEVL
jgi:hypothetical protein